MATLNPGDQAPDFNLRSTDGETVSLSDQRGSNVVLAFFPAAFTGVCQTEMCTFRDSLSVFNEMNAKVFGISVDPPSPKQNSTRRTTSPSRSSAIWAATPSQHTVSNSPTSPASKVTT